MVAPTSADDETKSSNSKNNPENPFIKFRRFADTQVGTVLQGIIGLPSAFSKQSSEANARWADFQDELKRKERVHPDAGASETSKTSTRCASDDEPEYSAKLAGDRFSPASSQSKSPSLSTNAARGLRQSELNLYSPITKVMFNNLSRASPDETDVDKASSIGFQSKFKTPWELFDDRKPMSALSTIQSMVYNDLFGIAPRTNLFDHMHSSIIPYVLFSPYSPLALSNMPTPSKGQSLHGRNRRDFPYMAAFEDLLLASQGRRMGFWTHVRGEPFARLVSHYDETMFCPDSAVKSSVNLELANKTRKVGGGLAWVRNLYNYGLLGPVLTDAERAVAQQPSYLQVAEQEQCKDNVSPYSGSEHEYLSEQDVYDQLLEMDHQDSSALSVEYIMKILAMVNDGNFLCSKVFKVNGNNDSEKGQDTLVKNSVRSAERSDFGHLILELLSEAQMSTSTSTQTESSYDSFPKTSNSQVTTTKQETREEESEARADRPITTTRTTEQTTSESGTVETKVTIEKIFADGRRNVTITEHVEVPSERWQTVREGDAKDWKERKGETAEGNAEGNKYNDKGKKNTRGWFWN